jgi:hypothetical protein
MSARDLLREFKAMRTNEQKKFLREARASGRRVGRARVAPRTAAWPDVQARAMRITGGRILPNLILVERENAAF